MSWVYFQEEWSLQHKVTFDGPNRLIIIGPNTNEISVKQDLYSDWKEWVSLYDYSKYVPAFRVTGGDPIGGGQYTGDVYFLINNWRIVINHSCTIDGVIYSDDYPSPFVPIPGTQIVTNKVSSLVTAIETNTGGSGGNVTITPSEIASAVWNAVLSNYNAVGTFGYTNQLPFVPAPTVTQIRQEMDTNSSKLASISANTASIINYTDNVEAMIANLQIPSATDIRQEIDANSTQLANISANTVTLQSSTNNLAVEVWSVETSGNTAAGTFGAALAAAGSGGVDPALIADAVWNANANVYITSGTMGNLVNQTSSLTPEQETMILEMYRLMGLDPTKPLIVTQTSRTAGANIAQTITSTSTSTTVIRT